MQLCAYAVSVSLIGVDGGNANRTSRFANYLRNMQPGNDIGVMVMRAKAVGRLAQVGGIFSADYVEFEVMRALECLDGDRIELRRHDAVSEIPLYTFLSFYPSID